MRFAGRLEPGQTDDVSEVFLVASIVGLALTVNAYRPLRVFPFTTSMFFASWLTMELAPQLLAIHVVTVPILAATGALAEPSGWIGLALAAGTAAGLWGLVLQGMQTGDVVEHALREGLGEDYLEHIAPTRRVDHDLRVPWRQLILPFHMTHPDVERIRNVPYGPHGRRNRLDVYRHRERPQGAPVLLFIHGGGWSISNKDQQGKPIMLHFASRGWVCFAPNYRLSPKATWPDHIVDVKRAIAWIREHGHEYGADPSFIVVTGGSAGGHLAALAGTSGNDPRFQPGFEEADTRVQGAIPHYGVYDFLNSANIRAARARTGFLARRVMRSRPAAAREDWEAASPHWQVDRADPPFFVIHGAHDSLVPVQEARNFVHKLREVGRVPVVYVELPGAQHAFDVFPSIRTAHVIRGAERFADWAYARRLEQRAEPITLEEAANP